VAVTGPLTADQLEGGICNALAAGDIGAVGDFLRVLVGIDPIRAEKVYETLRVAVWLTWLANGGEEG
jgi:hypothetical protein